jgi:hypothetical protein
MGMVEATIEDLAYTIRYSRESDAKKTEDGEDVKLMKIHQKSREKDTFSSKQRFEFWAAFRYP